MKPPQNAGQHGNKRADQENAGKVAG